VHLGKCEDIKVDYGNIPDLQLDYQWTQRLNDYKWREVPAIDWKTIKIVGIVK